MSHAYSRENLGTIYKMNIWRLTFDEYIVDWYFSCHLYYFNSTKRLILALWPIDIEDIKQIKQVFSLLPSRLRRSQLHACDYVAVSAYSCAIQNLCWKCFYARSLRWIVTFLLHNVRGGQPLCDDKKFIWKVCAQRWKLKTPSKLKVRTPPKTLSILRIRIPFLLGL